MHHIIKCFLTVTPNEKFYNFIKQLPEIENIYICIDKNDHNIPNYDGKIKIIKIDNKICENEGFKNTHSRYDGATSREKALYYFYKNNINYKYIWFLEEDVFIPTLKTIENIDLKYPNNDLLIPEEGKGAEVMLHLWGAVRSNPQGSQRVHVNSSWPHWCMVKNQLKGKISLPYYRSMVCAIRCSKKLLDLIFSYALKYKTLFFCEVMFNTIALHNNLNIADIKELKTISWNNVIGQNEININNLYHPIKSISEQYRLRKLNN